ncbi:hypothetical protein GW17_00006334 [Ensete ventricosum]|nr:hypothetical protein GW17_00006334 [Ensete ventricosum]
MSSKSDTKRSQREQCGFAESHGEKATSCGCWWGYTKHAGCVTSRSPFFGRPPLASDADGFPRHQLRGSTRRCMSPITRSLTLSRFASEERGGGEKGRGERAPGVGL